MGGKRSEPALEKTKDYKHQRVNVAEYPKRAVVSRRKKKKGLNRQVRRKVGQLLHEETPLREDQEHRLPESLKVRRIHRAESMALGAALESKQGRRGRTVGANFFKQPYSSLQAEAFAVFLEALTTGISEKQVVRNTAAYFALCLEPQQDPKQARWLLSKQQWFERFFKDRPDWRAKLLAWIEQMQ
jgi:hypothetical protein